MNISPKNRNSRRTFIGQVTLAGLGAMIGMPFASAASLLDRPAATNAPNSILIKNAYVLSMDKAVGDLENGDILIENGIISAVKSNIVNSKAMVIDGKGMIALPGFVETHWHIWTSLMRGMAGGKDDYFTTSIKYGKLYSPDNTYHATRLALAEAIASGITHVHDWSHNTLSAEHAQASLKALEESGIRGRFSLGVGSGQSDVDLNILTSLRQNWSRYNSAGLLNLGLAWPGIENNRPAGRKEIETARKLGLPVSVHVGRRKDGSDAVGKIADAGLLDNDLQLVHCIDTTAEEFSSIARAGASVSASPFSELRIGYGLTPVAEMLKCGAAIGLSVDTTPLSGNADMFAVMKVVMNLADGMQRNEFEVSSRRILEMATIEGARSMGMGQSTGSLSPGKKADLQLIDTRAINLGVITDPYHTLITAAQPHNVDTVMVNGNILKRAGKLSYVDADLVIKEASLSLKDLMARGGV